VEETVAKLTKEMLSLAGEYAVASELCRRGLYSQLTLGNHKRTDILVETETRMIRVSVKAKQGNEWPSISGPVRDDDFLVFVDFASKAAGDNLDFFILSKDDGSEVVKQEVLNQKNKGKELKFIVEQSLGRMDGKALTLKKLKSLVSKTNGKQSYPPSILKKQRRYDSSQQSSNKAIIPRQLPRSLDERSNDRDKMRPIQRIEIIR
jgi:hypothetical protein